MAYEHEEVGDFASERDAQDWAERNNIDPQDLRCRARGRRGVTLNVRRSALGDSARGDPHTAAGPTFSRKQGDLP